MFYNELLEYDDIFTILYENYKWNVYYLLETIFNLIRNF